jgi:hypothetical protein
VVEKFKYLGVTLSATNALMLAEAKRACDNFTMVVAKKYIVRKLRTESHIIPMHSCSIYLQ